MIVYGRKNSVTISASESFFCVSGKSGRFTGRSFARFLRLLGLLLSLVRQISAEALTPTRLVAPSSLLSQTNDSLAAHLVAPTERSVLVPFIVYPKGFRVGASISCTFLTPASI